MWLVDYVMGSWKELLEVMLGLVGVMGMVAVMTPNKSDDKLVQMLLDWVNFLGANVGKAKNSDKM